MHYFGGAWDPSTINVIVSTQHLDTYFVNVFRPGISKRRVKWEIAYQFVHPPRSKHLVDSQSIETIAHRGDPIGPLPPHGNLIWQIGSNSP